MSLRFESVSKRFPGVLALDGVDFEARAGQVHGLLGENGAGKSTLLKILGGQYRPDAGRLLIDGSERNFGSAREAIAAGVAVIHQELHYVPQLTVTENLLLGRLPRRLGFVDHRAARRLVVDRLADMGVTLDPDAKLGELSIGERQMVEICKALMLDARVIAFDEPTSSLSHRESEILFKLVRRLRDEGRTLIYISHRLEELYALCNACTVLRDGRRVASHSAMADVPGERLIQDMVGRELKDIYGRRAASPGMPNAQRLSVQGLCGNKLKAPASFEIKAGEVLGFFGLVGAGRSELMRLVCGADRAQAGQVLLDGVALPGGDPRRAIDAGVVLCPEDRKEQGLITPGTVAENINIAVRRGELRGRLFVRHAREAERAEAFIRRLRIKTPHRRQDVRLLSGGNQQKVILARWLAEPQLKLLILDEPTRGIDVGARSEIYSLIHEVAAGGCAVIVVSSELPELLGIAHRIVVMREGRIAGELPRETATEAAVLALALPDSADSSIPQS